MENVLVVCNFKAGRKTAIKYKKRVIKFLFRRTNSFKFIQIEELETINIEHFDTIIAMGGDGTINKIVPYIIGTEKVLGIIPCGTANLLAAKLGIPSKIKKALNVLKKRNIKQIDVISINGKASVLRFGLGYDADIICKTPQSIKNKFGYFSYFIAGILFALRLRKKEYELFFDNKKLSIKASCIIVANATNMYHNLVSVGNNCSLDDGLMDIFILKTVNPIMFFIEFLRIIFNYRTDNSRAKYFKTSKLKISNKWLFAHVDGDKTKFLEDLHFDIIPKALNVYTSK